jgi:hypothetical protein
MILYQSFLLFIVFCRSGPFSFDHCVVKKSEHRFLSGNRSVHHNTEQTKKRENMLFDKMNEQQANSGGESD